MTLIRRSRRVSQHRALARHGEPCDDALLKAWLNGDRCAGQLFVERHQRTVRSYVARHTRDDVDDLVQQIFLTCMMAGTSYRGEGSARAFLLGIARNQLSAAWRRRARALRAQHDPRVDPEECEAPKPDDALAWREVSLEGALRRLPSEQSRALRLVYWDGLTRDVVARGTRVPPGTVASRLRLAKLRLRQLIEIDASRGDADCESAESQDGDEDEEQLSSERHER